MVFIQSVLKCNDNSGVLYVKCLHIVNKKKKESGDLGDIIKVSILKKKTLIFKKQQKIFLGLILGLKKKKKRLNGIYSKQHQNRVVLLNSNYKLLGTRIYGPACRELLNNSLFSKLKPVLVLSRGII